MNITGCISRMACEEDIQKTLKNIKEELKEETIYDKSTGIGWIKEEKIDKTFLKHQGEMK